MKVVSKVFKAKVKFSDLEPGEKFTYDSDEEIYEKVVPDAYQFRDNDLKSLYDLGLAKREGGKICLFTNTPKETLVCRLNSFKAVVEFTDENEFNEMLGCLNAF